MNRYQFSSAWGLFMHAFRSGRVSLALRLSAAATLAVSLLVSGAPLGNAEPTPEPVATTQATLAATPDATTSAATPDATTSATPTPTPTPPPSPTPSPTTPAKSPEAKLTDTAPIYAGMPATLTGTFHTNGATEAWGEVWRADVNRWSRAAKVQTSATGEFTIPLTWGAESTGTQRWRAGATLPNGTEVFTPEVSLVRLALPRVAPVPVLRPGQATTASGTFATTAAMPVWGEVWRADVNRWSRAAAFSTDATGAFSIQLTWGSESGGTQEWRVGATDAQGRTMYTASFDVTRRREATVSTPRVIPVGQQTTTFGNFDTRTAVTVWGEVWRTDVNRWSRTASIRSAANGDYTIGLNFMAEYAGTQKWRVAGQYPDGTIEYTREFDLTRRTMPTFALPMVLPANYPMSTSGSFHTSGPIKVWGEVWRTDINDWSATAPVTTSASGAFTLPLNFMGDRRGFLRWRIAGRHADGTVQYTHEFMTQRTDPIDSRCMTGRVMCATKNGLRLWWVIDGKILKSFDARFGKKSLPTREGVHRVYWKSRYHVSSIYHVDMPWAMFFNGGQAVHYSAGFASMGHIGAGSAGCINLRDMAGIDDMYSQVRNGDKVVVYK